MKNEQYLPPMCIWVNQEKYHERKYVLAIFYQFLQVATLNFMETGPPWKNEIRGTWVKT